MKKLLLMPLLMMSLCAMAQNVMTPELLWKLGRITPLGLSNDGKNIVYQVNYPSVAENKSENKLENKIENKIQSNIANLEQTVRIYNSSLEDTANKLFAIFESGFGSFFVNPDEKIKVNGVDTPLISSGGYALNNNFAKVEAFTDLTGAVATIFAKSGDDFVRVSTSLKKEDGSRAMGTFLGKTSPAYEPIMKKQKYVGNARLFGKDYITVYAPIVEDGQILGGLHPI